ncbi:hypothetical protein ABZP36_002783 [Zizania latifolia]
MGLQAHTNKLGHHLSIFFPGHDGLSHRLNLWPMGRLDLSRGQRRLRSPLSPCPASARAAARNPDPGQCPRRRRPPPRPSPARGPRPSPRAAPAITRVRPPASARGPHRPGHRPRPAPAPASARGPPIGRSRSRAAPSISSFLARALSPSAGAGPQILSLAMAARAQAWQFAATLVIFHGSEYVLAAAFHGRRNVTATCE